MPIRINNITQSIEEDINLLKDKVAKKLRIKTSDIKELKILRESIDARKKNLVNFNYCIEINCENEEKVVARANNNNIKLEKSNDDEKLVFGKEKMEYRPVVVGMGPAGMFAALILAEKGYRPIVIERGQKVEERSKTVEGFWNGEDLNTESNVQFGEGGAGTFSDGKLTTRIKDLRIDYVLQQLVSSGAPKEILYSGKPHIGTDILKGVVKSIREKIIELGGEVRFNSKVEDLIIKNNALEKIIVNGEEIPCENVILAIGHSSRDTYEMLHKRGVSMKQKPFAIGVRIEHLQSMINENQYGIYADHPRLKAADYKLTHNTKEKRGVYSFCMCPGGVVVGASSEKGRLVTNGMSYYARDKKNANSALVVTVGPNDFKDDSPLSGMEFQRHYEELAFKLGGGNYKAPIQLVGDFLKDKISTKAGKIEPSYSNGYEFKMLKDCLPSYIINSLKEGIVEFDKKIKGFNDYDAIMTGIETRTSAPVRIERDEFLQSVSVKRLYPCGEGAGFAGGIMSAAVDGIRCAESIMKTYMPFS
ncbi:MAG: NAD(P)/FAD-dependent oxidoreductase [Clostridiaceae bacterium]